MMKKAALVAIACFMVLMMGSAAAQQGGNVDLPAGVSQNVA